MAFTPKKLKSVTRTLFKLANNREYYFKIQSPIHVGKKIGDKDPARLADVVDLETGEEGQIILGAVLVGIMEESYPGEQYVGRCFEIVKFRDAASAYNTYNVAEIADPADDEVVDAEYGTEPEPIIETVRGKGKGK